MSSKKSAAHFVVLTASSGRALTSAAGTLPGGVSFFPLDAEVVRIGAAPEAELFLSDPELSGIHARVEQREEGYVLVREQNPLLVNGMRVRVHVLAPFDMVVIGKNALSFRPGPAPKMEAIAASAASSAGATLAGGGQGARGGPPSHLDAIRRLTSFAARAQEGENPAILAERLMGDLLALTGATRGTLVRLSQDEDPVSLVACTQGSFSGGEVVVSRTLLAKMRALGQPLFVENTLADPDLVGAASIAGEPALSALCAPIFSEGRIVGAIYFSARASSRMTRDALELVELYATHAVSILESERKQARLTERLDLLGEKKDDDSLIVGESEPIGVLKKTLRKVSGSRAPVLVTGETGTGKELVAKEIHRLSTRARGPFIAVNCGAIPHELLASELFGHKRGAFTGASADRLGFFRSAEGGTLFLDEVGEMPLSQQVSLLRVLQEERVSPVGSEDSVPVDVRVVCATNRNLQEEVQAGRFRQDLYFRLAVVEVRLPPLRERPGDVLRLATHFLRRFAKEQGNTALTFSDDALLALQRARWEGNVRELEASIRRAVLMAEENHIGATELGLVAPNVGSMPPAPLVRPLSMARDEFLRNYVREVVERFGGNRTAAADALMVSARTVFKYMDE
jgi:transcriptional regulator with GAF, ATPase, and Fis domain